MNILFDQSEAQSVFYNGAAEYAQTIFLYMVKHIEEYPDVHIYCLYSSSRKFKYPQLSPETFNHINRITYVDMDGCSLKQIIEQYNIDKFFTPCLQLLCDKGIGNIKHLPCKVMVVIHDLLDQEMSKSGILRHQGMMHPLKYARYKLYRLKERIKHGIAKSNDRSIHEFIENNDLEIITVSNYSKSMILYNFPNFNGKISVFYSPMKTAERESVIKNNELRKLIESGQKFMIIVSANRPLKNAERMIRAFSMFSKTNKYKLVTIGWDKPLFRDHITLPYISSSDLENAYMHCQALLYPSLFEGFGYPPLEAMKYGKPVICSYACSMPEVLENAPIYFSPIYETDMYKALCDFSKSSYKELSSRAYKQYLKVLDRQNNDLKYLTRKIMTTN